MDATVHHCRAVPRGVRHALVVGDPPFGSYEVKLEGAHPGLVEALRDAGVAVMGHLGLTPRSVHTTGGAARPGATSRRRGQQSSLKTRTALSRRKAGHTWSRSGTCGSSVKIRSRVRPMGKYPAYMTLSTPRVLA